MKSFFTLLSLLAISLFSFGQTEVFLKIDHQLGTDAFAFNTESANNMGNAFDVARMEYYISEIRVIHDGGQETMINDKWLLVNADAQVYESLGMVNFTAIEGVKFSIGVDPAHNNLDPSTYPDGHPLAHKTPSMHWGWTAGYRFVAMEGMSTSALDQSFQIHALGNVNYFTTTVMTAGRQIDGGWMIDLDGDYARAVENIDLDQAPINHGETGSAVTVLENFRDYVFSEGDGTPVSVNDLTQNQVPVTLYPNPLASGQILTLAGDLPAGSVAVVTGILGNQVGAFPINSVNATIELRNLEAGTYQVSVLNDGATLSSQKLLVVD